MTKFYEIFRTALHVLVGLTIGYDVTSLTDFNTYSGVDQAVGLVCIGIIVIVVAGFWEWLQSVLFKANFDRVDIIVTGAAGIAGAAIALSWQSDWMFWGLLGASTVFIVRELIHYYKLLRNR